MNLKQANNARASAAAQTFIKRAGESFGPYDSEKNCQRIYDRILEVWGESGTFTPDSYEIAFAELLSAGELVKNRNYVAPSMRAEIETLPVAEQTRRYRTDPEFRRVYDLIDSDPNAGRSADDPYRGLTAHAYWALPAVQQAELYARNPSFQRAVSRLIDRGEI